MDNIEDKLAKALSRLSFAAQTTGGVAGPDPELMAAIDQAGDALDSYRASKDDSYRGSKDKDQKSWLSHNFWSGLAGLGLDGLDCTAKNEDQKSDPQDIAKVLDHNLDRIDALLEKMASVSNHQVSDDIVLIPKQPDEEVIEAMHDTYKTAYHSGISGMSIDSQWRSTYSRELAVYRAIISHYQSGKIKNALIGKVE